MPVFHFKGHLWRRYSVKMKDIFCLHSDSDIPTFFFFFILWISSAFLPLFCGVFLSPNVRATSASQMVTICSQLTYFISTLAAAFCIHCSLDETRKDKCINFLASGQILAILHLHHFIYMRFKTQITIQKTTPRFLYFVITINIDDHQSWSIQISKFRFVSS